jgi:hypothetical protein
VRADIEILDHKSKIIMSFHRNADSSLPASHTVEVIFIPADFSSGGVSNLPGILLKSNEQARSTPAGLAVKIIDGFFLVGLSNVDADRQRSVQLLKERPFTCSVPSPPSAQREFHQPGMKHGANGHDLAQAAVSKLGRPHTGRSFRQTPHYAAPYFLRPIWSPSNYSPFRDHIQNAGTPA